jgi:hypothetical protein
VAATGGRDPEMAAVLALVLAACPDDAVRDPARALELARGAYAAVPAPVSGLILAVAYAAAGRFEEAVRAQERLVAALEGTADPAALAAARRRFALYRAGQPVRAPWTDDPGLLPPPALPLPATGDDAEP